MPIKVKLLKFHPLPYDSVCDDLKERGQPTVNCPPFKEINLTWTLANF